jgi:hypothetical protein
MIGYVYILFGMAQIATGILMNRFIKDYNNFKLATFGGFLV